MLRKALHGPQSLLIDHAADTQVRSLAMADHRADEALVAPGNILSEDIVRTEADLEKAITPRAPEVVVGRLIINQAIHLMQTILSLVLTRKLQDLRTKAP